jgi:hypothetical protein
VTAPGRGRWRDLALLLAWLALVALGASWYQARQKGNARPGAASPEASPAGATPGARRWVAGSDDPLPPTAQPARDAEMRADEAAPRSPADGGGSVRLELAAGDDGSVVASASRSWTLVYEAGPLGVAEGGALLFYSPLFWFWSPAQLDDEQRPGFTRISTEAAGVVLDPIVAQQYLVLVRVGGRALAAGERVRIEYGAGPAGAQGDRFAERRSRFVFAVDGDGDGISGRVAEVPAIEIRPGPAAQLVATLQSSARPGQPVRLTLAALDVVGNAGVALEDDVELQLPPGLTGPSRLRLPADGHGVLQATLQAGAPGVFRVAARTAGGLAATSNPLEVSEDAPRVLWADLHGHSALSDGTGTPHDYYTYARDVAALDVSALTDHDHWGSPFIDQTPALWAEIAEQTRAFHEPGRFVTLLGFEWTSWIHGHRHVLYFADEGPLLSSLAAGSSSPSELWGALAGRDALTVAHHTAGGPIAENWSFRPDPVLEPVTEIMSVHGSSEAVDSPELIYDAVAGNFARDALEAGYRLGFIGSGDGHDGHPGLTRLASPRPGLGGLAAIFSEEATRPAVLAALRRRACYATNGARILLHATLDGRPMGASGPPGEGRLELRAAGTAEIARVSLVRSGALVEQVAGDGADFAHVWTLPGLVPGEWAYVRVEQVDGGLAWCSPFFVE